MNVFQEREPEQLGDVGGQAGAGCRNVRCFGVKQ